MQESFDPALNAQVVQEDDGRVRGIRYQDEYAESDQDSPLTSSRRSPSRCRPAAGKS
ncbi:hypothetical protein JOF56_000723 [Kibdelosporangium banguiense]|uniref:Uncharacterized protein n=1 Tax=Kibdelosporangium banguiense TaxID=1365924 RepID=A0ABS4T7H7_9PSEU|nr:hypothetical protein [Kibdelosporangium banguiense]MBP2320338.1 hypothetical protein [Kibdelosporangium banguiense]